MSGDLVVGDLIAYRAWRIKPGEQALWPLNPMHGPWAGVSVTAATPCHRGDHAGPRAGCTCGLYAYYRPSTVTTAPGTVFGVVSVRGRVILASRGLKAERMMIRALVAEDEVEAEALARYGVPIYPSREALLSDYPPQDYSELIEVDPTDPPDVSVSFSLAASSFIQAATKAAMQMEQAAERIRATVAAHGETFRQLAEQLAEAGLVERPLPEDAMARALELRKHRNTGPAPRRLDGRR